MIYEIPIKPIPNRIKYPAALTNTEIKNMTAITGFLEVITKTLERREPKANKSIKIFFMLKIKRLSLHNIYYTRLYINLTLPFIYPAPSPPSLLSVPVSVQKQKVRVLFCTETGTERGERNKYLKSFS